MAAPSNTVWGSVSGQGRLGISVSASSTNTQTTLTVGVWLWLKYNISDSSNSYSFSYTNDSGSTSTSSDSNLSLSFGTTSGAGWDEDASQKQIKTHTLTYTRGTSSKTINLSAALNNLGSEEYDVSASTSYTIPALASYTVSYNANGGSGAPSSQTKYYGKTLTLSSAKPTRTGYTFSKWNTKSDGSGTSYNAGASYTANSAVTLYAIWTEHKLTVNYYSNYATYGTYEGTALTVSSSTNVKVHSQDFYYDNSYSSALSNVQNTSYLYLARMGYTPTGYWGTSTTGGNLVDEDGTYTGQSLAVALGKTLASGNASVNVYPQWEINTYTFSYNANADTASGTMDSVTVEWGETFILPDNLFKREGYKFIGWNAYKNVDSTWYVAGQGWITEDAILEGGYEKKLYQSQEEHVFGSSWVKGNEYAISDYTMYAVWEISGVVYIDNGTTFEPYLAYIDDGTSWNLYLMYVDNGTDWDIIS